MTISLAGKVAIVTGASRGVGAAAAIALAQQGCAVVCAARSTDANGINNAGEIVGYYSIGQGATLEHGFLFSGGIYTSFDVPGAAVIPGVGFTASARSDALPVDGDLQALM